MKYIHCFLLLCVIACGFAGPVITFNDNGAWCWYEDERVIVHNGTLIIGSVADSSGTGGWGRDGDIEVTTYDIAAGTTQRFTLHDNLQADDHNSPALLPLPDGKILAMYAKHGSDHYIRYRITTHPNDTSAWQSEVQLNRGVGVTYSNVYRLSAENGGSGRIYDFYRGENYNPNCIISDNNGQSWSYGGHLIRKDNHRPYARYVSNNVDKIHFITTEGHPRNYNNSIYHGYLYNGGIYKSDGTFIRNLSAGPVAPEELTKVYQGGVNNVAWTTGIRLDSAGRPYIAFTVHIKPDVDGISDLRYFYGRWTGSQWNVYEIAYAGTELYNGEDDYTGLVALNPHDPDVLYISTNADPDTGAALISSADGKRHWELYQGVTTDAGANWSWHPMTENSTTDNLRPIMPVWDGQQSVLLWMRGTYTSYTNFNTDIVGMFDPKPICQFSNPTSYRVDTVGDDCVVDLLDLEAFLSAWMSSGLVP